METTSFKCFIKAMLFTLLFSTFSWSQENLSFTITPELTKEISSEIRNFKVYRVIQRDIEYHPYIEGEVNTNEYNVILDKLDELRPHYNKYSEKLKEDSISRVNIRLILQNIDSYLASKEKSDIKDKYLIKAQEIADKQKIEITGENKSFLSKKLNDHGVIKNNIKTFKLHNGKKSSSKKDIKFYRSEIEKIKITEPYMSSEVKKYLELIDKEKNIQKTEPGKVLSSETLKRQAFLIDKEININSLSGDFIQMPEQYMLAKKDIKNEILANELSSDNKFSGVYGMTQRYPLIKKKGTENYYYIMSSNYLSKLFTKQRIEELISIVNKLGYKEYKKGDDYYIKSKTAEIRLDIRTYNEFQKSANYVATLDADQAKISTLINQTIPHSKTLDKYLSQYRIQRNQMPTASINKWRNATSDAQKLLDQINKLSEKYDGNYSFKLLNRSNTLDVFLDNILASKGVLGM